MKGSVKQLNPEGLHKNPAYYSQAVVTTGSGRTVYVGGQNAVDASGKVVGRGDIGAQAQQIFKRTWV
jgi:enamine deaminase RidA (YjgF/YER057c/UK114 family)